MQVNVPLLEKKAIKLALAEQWEDAIAINDEILEHQPNDLKALLRQGRAYLQIKNFTKAAKLFKQALAIDPINNVAQKNYDSAKNKKLHTVSATTNGKSLVKEPGTTKEVEVEISKKGITANAFAYGQMFAVDVLVSKANIKHAAQTIAEVTDKSTVKRLNQASKRNAELSAVFIKGENKSMKILLQCSEPVFESFKQDVRPYMKKGSIDEPELEIESFDDE